MPCSSVISTPGMAAAIRWLSRSVWSASAACERSSLAMLLACLIWVATIAATACTVARTSSSPPVTSPSPIRARANRHCPPTGTERASGTPGELAVSVPILASSASSTAPPGDIASTVGSGAGWPAAPVVG